MPFNSSILHVHVMGEDCLFRLWFATTVKWLLHGNNVLVYYFMQFLKNFKFKTSKVHGENDPILNASFWNNLHLTSWNLRYKKNEGFFLSNQGRRFMAEILRIQRKTLSNQSINQCPPKVPGRHALLQWFRSISIIKTALLRVKL